MFLCKTVSFAKKTFMQENIIYWPDLLLIYAGLSAVESITISKWLEIKEFLFAFLVASQSLVSPPSPEQRDRHSKIGF